MAQLKISDKGKQSLQKAAKSEIERLENILQNTEDIDVVDAFKNRFNICESAYKIILAAHQNFKGTAPITQLKIDMRQVPAALAFAGYTFEKQLLSELFGGKPTVNGRTAKQLRDATSHGFDKSAVKEIVSRRAELYSYMDMFIESIRNFNEVAV